MLLIRFEGDGDHDAVRQVNRLAFNQEAEALLVDGLRASYCARVSLVAEMDDKVVGHIMFSDLSIITQERTVPALALAPLAVLPSFQKMGIGSALVLRGLEACKERAHRIVIVLGHPDFYPRFGFSAKLTMPLEAPYSGSPSFMAAELVPEALRGIAGKVEYSLPFNAL